MSDVEYVGSSIHAITSTMNSISLMAEPQVINAFLEVVLTKI